jgi:hypothetical protein
VNDPVITLPHLRTLIGLRVRYRGEICVVVEILESPPALVLELLAPATLMADQHGHPWEYAMENRVIRILSDDRTGLNDESAGTGHPRLTPGRLASSMLANPWPGDPRCRKILRTRVA